MKAWKLSPAAIVLATSCASSTPTILSDAVPAGEASAERLHDDVAWLADDAREGRRAGTDGEKAAAQFIARRFEQLGLVPLGDGSYFQEFEVPLPARVGDGSTVEADGLELRGDALVPLFCSSAGEAEGPTVFCGYGVSDGDLGFDDFAAVEPGGVALIVRGTPPFDPAGETWGNAGSLFTKVMNAKRAGYAAVLVAQHPDSTEPLAEFDPGQSARASIPALMLTAAAAERLWPGYAERVAALDARGGPLGLAEAERGARAKVTADVIRSTGPAWNVLAGLPDRDGDVVMVGAHYDHLGHGGSGSLAPGSLGEIHNGADDNASGTAVVLELARLFRAAPPSSDTQLVFALWSGEELGLLGSEHWVDEPTFDLDRVRGYLNLDMVGRAGDGSLQVLGVGTSPAFESWMEPAGEGAELELSLNLSGAGLGGSDHQTFLNRGIPALHLFSGIHADYHKPSDDTERFEAEGARRVTELSRTLMESMVATAELPYVEPPREEAEGQRGAGWSTWFGSVPAYDHDGPGLLLSGTSAGSPAERAGLLAGDIIVHVEDIEIDTIHDFVYMLQVYKPGSLIDVTYLRDGERETVALTLGTRAHQ